MDTKSHQHKSKKKSYLRRLRHDSRLLLIVIGISILVAFALAFVTGNIPVFDEGSDSVDKRQLTQGKSGQLSTTNKALTSMNKNKEKPLTDAELKNKVNKLISEKDTPRVRKQISEAIDKLSKDDIERLRKEYEQKLKR
ncbi:MAG: hypothetical protein H8D23_22740 [Candidatus Brocadiales bacterium]|nr:hypothetical protein [Candidatus Brocadiales bacterium]